MLQLPLPAVDFAVADVAVSVAAAAFASGGAVAADVAASSCC